MPSKPPAGASSRPSAKRKPRPTASASKKCISTKSVRVDSICDIVGICRALHLLNIDKIYCSAINTGSGTVFTEHGVLPVPAPATARLLAGKPIYARGPALELTTPTGAAIVAALADGFGAMPAMTVRAIGYGAGDHDFKEHANIVRVMVGEANSAPESTTVSVIEANIDDASPQIIAWASEKTAGSRRARCHRNPGSNEKRTVPEWCCR